MAVREDLFTTADSAHAAVCCVTAAVISEIGLCREAKCARVCVECTENGNDGVCVSVFGIVLSLLYLLPVSFLSALRYVYPSSPLH